MKKAVWGWLYPLRDELKPLELKKDEYIFGTDLSCSYVLSESHFDKLSFKDLSKKQFKILKKKDGIYLEDLDSTYVNNKKVGKGQRVPLVHNNYIAIAKMHIKVFAFLERTESDKAALALPDEINEKYHQSRELGKEQVIDKLSSSAMFIVMEYMDGGNLLERIYPYKSLNESNMKLIFFQLVQAIQCLHQHNYVHRDIKVVYC
ncbi:hypothetical protein C0J52_22250 [Blattella germanica]|nr:hypothetical protein C0J52_22250 [Blattella germanica]